MVEGVSDVMNRRRPEVGAAATLGQRICRSVILSISLIEPIICQPCYTALRVEYFVVIG